MQKEVVINKIFPLIGTGILIATLFITPLRANAATINCDDPRLSLNNIQFWNPCDEECEAPGGTGSTSIGGNKDYKGDSVFNEAQMASIKEHMPVYQEAAQAANIPWQLLAVMHARESGLKLYYNSNAQGIYQDYEGRGTYPTGREATREEFLKESIYAAEILKNKVPGKEDKLAAGDLDTIKDAFFGYNGRAGVYVRQALDLGFDQAGADRGEGSPYVMNKADDKRDPNSNPSGWGQIKIDGGPIAYPANQDHGAFVMYAALSDGVQTSSSCGSSDVGLVAEGGLTEEQAKKFMINYGKNPNGYSQKAVGDSLWNICNGQGSNCVTFSAFFMNSFTDLRAPNGMWGNGGQVVDNQVAAGAKSGTEPKVYAVFGHSTGVTMCGSQACGHTGIVLGIHGDTIIVGHASCSRQGRGAGDGTINGSGSGYIMVAKLNDLNGAFHGTQNLRFAYPDKVDTDKINDFLKM